MNKRISSISANEDVFKASCQPFQEALEKSGYNFELKYQKQSQKETKNRRKSRNVTYFNPPFSLSVKTKIGEKFLRALDKCFPPYHPLSKLINRNTVKLSYKCMPNVKHAISRHNQQVKRGRAPTNPVAGCNCLPDRECPLDGNCLVQEVIYQAQVVEEDGNINTYTGLTGNTFKERYYGHTSSFRHRDEEHKTTLSSHIWKLEDEGKKYKINWKIIDRGKKFNPSNRKCNLCLKEKFHIIFQPEGAKLNKRSELFST